mmetsp:Transcript_11365/g.21271  ORF Transcript_11365/g.21271 Transcript_11365/m.21271 type:complete len:84 (+) Transcript_11365:157-408(+)
MTVTMPRIRILMLHHPLLILLLIFHHKTNTNEDRMKRINGDSTSDRILNRISSEREHPPGVRRVGCPCCDPDNIENVVESMLL